MNILHSRLLVLSGRFGQRADELRVPDNRRVAVEISLVSCIQAEIRIIPNLFMASAAICDMPLIWRRTIIVYYSNSNNNNNNSSRPVVNLPRKHGCSLWNFNAILFTNWDIRVWSFDAALLDFPLPVASGRFTGCSILMAVIQMGGILFLSHLEVELSWGVFLPHSL